jgi:hypothetical protein
MLNRAEYIAAWIGFSKVGVATALINTNLTGHALAHCLNIVQRLAGGHRRGLLEAGRGRPSLSRRNLMLWVAGPEGRGRGRRAARPGQAGAQRLLGAARPLGARA